MSTHQCFWEAEVRDNETDFQGIVSNANYFVYMMHARTRYFRQLGLDFNAMHVAGYDFVLVHTDISFKAPLKSGDEFVVASVCKPRGRIRFIFEQEVIRKSDSKVVAFAINTVACLSTVTRRPVVPPEVFRNIFCSV